MTSLNDDELDSLIIRLESPLFQSKEVGDLVGSGLSRQVYLLRSHPDLVLKVEKHDGRFQNVLEWLTWNRVRYTQFRYHFAPCYRISNDGALLLMHRTQITDVYPVHIPNFFTDLKRSNFGEIDGKFVCHDYGTHLLMEKGMRRQMRNAEWWG